VWADIGSGAGFPGLVLGVLLRGRPGARIHLIESTAKRCGFLRAAVEDLDLPCTVHQARAETLRLDVEVVTARACAPLERLLAYAQPYFARGARGLFLKGEGVGAEIIAARRIWRFDAKVGMSLSDPRGRVLSIGRLARAANP
jgi:16S rRNA (guanine527-N7)-methyltransferase